MKQHNGAIHLCALTAAQLLKNSPHFIELKGSLQTSDRPVTKHTVTYSGVLFTMELYCTPKVNTLQLNTVGNSWNTRTRPTRTVSEPSLL
jgi:hypothetical protein